MVEEEERIPPDFRLALPALGVWIGAAVGVSGHWAPAISVAAAGVAGAVLSRRSRARFGALAAVAALLGGLVAAGCAVGSAAADPLLTAAAAGSWAEIDGTVSGFPSAVRSGFPVTDATGQVQPRFAVPLDASAVRVAGRSWRPVAGITAMGTGASWATLVPGTSVRVAGLLRADAQSILPAVLVQARDPPRTLSRPPWWQRLAGRIRAGLTQSAAGLDPDARGLLPGLVVGDTSAIPDQLSTDAKATGLTHLLAVSGSHFSLLCAGAVLLFRRFGSRFAAVGGAGVIVALVVLVGPQPSVLRAAVMAGFAVTGLAIGRPGATIPALSGAVFGLLLWQPALAVSAGFILSVLATAGLVLLAPTWSRGLRRRGWPAGWAGLVVVPAAAGLATMPVIAALSGSVSLASLPANLLAEPVVAPALVIGLLAGVVGLWWPLAARALAGADRPLLDWIAGVAHRLANWSVATVPWPATVAGVLTLAGLAVAALLVLRHRRFRGLALAASVGAAVILIPAHFVSLGWPPPGWVVVACEVGQGDGMVISTGEPNTAVVVDTGPDPDLMDGCVNRLHVTSIPLLVLTHLHADHVDGLPGALRGRSVGAVGMGPDRDPAAAWTAVNSEAAAAAVPIVGLPQGTRWATGSLALTVLGPAAAFHGTDSDPNNDSVTTLITRDGVRILMTGDIETEAQQQLLDGHADLRADVLEQPHHGSSKVLPAFTRAVSPRVSLIGVGLHNDYGQPNPKALAQLAGIGATVLRTDQNGDAAVCLTGGQLRVVTRGAVLHGSTPTPGGDE